MIAGGGPAGSVAAHALARHGAAVAIVTPSRPASRRLEIVSPRTTAAFAAAGLDTLLHDPAIARPCAGIEHVDARGLATRQPFADGYVVDRGALDQALLREADRSGAILIAGRVRGCTRRGGVIMLHLSGGAAPACIAAPQVIDATGRPASVARRLGATSLRGERRIAAPLDSGGRPRSDWMRVAWDAAGWTTTMAGPATVDTWRVARRETGAPVTAGSRDAGPRLLEPAAGPGWAAIGDAAAAFDPVNSQGLDHAINSALVVTGAILAMGRPDAAFADAYDAANRLTAISADRARTAVYGAA